jgi:hypothetical protein
MSSLLRKNNFYLVFSIILFSFSSAIFSQENQLVFDIKSNPTDLNYWWLEKNNFGRKISDFQFEGSIEIDHKDTEFYINFFSTHSKSKIFENIYLNESFIKYNFSDKTFLRFGRYYRDFSEYLNENLSSGSMIISKNAQAMPKIGIVSSKKTKNSNIDFNYGISHGVFDKNTIYSKPPFLHEKFVYMNVKKNEYQMSFGFVHSAMWSGSIEGKGSQPNSFEDFLRIFIAADEKVTEDTVVFPHVNALGNHVGIWDFFISKKNNDKVLGFYYQHFFEDTSGLRFRNGIDGLWGIEVKNYIPNTNFLIEYLDTTNTYEDSYYQHSIYTLGWSYKGFNIGNPLVDRISNRPKKVFHVGIDGKLLTSYYRTIFSRKININDSIKYKVMIGKNIKNSSMEIILANNERNKINIGLAVYYNF